MYYKDLRIIIDVTCGYFIKITLHTSHNRDSKSETNFGITCSKCLMKLLSDLVDVGILEISNINLRAILILGLIWPGKYFIKTIFDTKILIGIFEIANVPNFNKL